MKQNTYQRDPAGIEEARAEIRAANQLPDRPEDLAWQDNLPELPDDDDDEAVHAEFHKGDS